MKTICFHIMRKYVFNICAEHQFETFDFVAHGSSTDKDNVSLSSYTCDVHFIVWGVFTIK